MKRSTEPSFRCRFGGWATSVLTVVIGALALGAAASPVNDSFRYRTRVSGTKVTVQGRTIGATREPGEPNHARTSAGHSVWFSWTAPTNGTLAISVGDASTPSLLHLPLIALYTGDRPARLTNVADNLYDGVPSGETSLIVAAGRTYQIAVDAKAGAPVQKFGLSLDFTPAPRNDHFTNRIRLSGTSVSFSGMTRAATRERDEPALQQYSSQKSVWWSWTAPADGLVTLQAEGQCIGGGCVPSVSVFTGSVLKKLTLVATGGGESNYEMRFEVAKGRAYQIRVEDIYASGRAALWLGFHSFRLLSPLHNSSYPLGSNVVVKLASPFPRLDGQITRVDFFLPNHELLASVTGPPFDLIWTNPTLGSHYLFAVATNSTGRVLISPAVTFWVRPSNDQFARRSVIEGVSATVTGQVTYATSEEGEPRPVGGGGRTLWWTWTAPADGLLRFDDRSGFFQRPPFDPGWLGGHGVVVIDKRLLITGPLLAVYTGDSLENLSLIASNVVPPPRTFGGWGVTSPVKFTVIAGTRYHLLLDGVNGSSGEAIFQLSFTPAPPNDDFAHATMLQGFTNYVSGSLLSATAEPGEPQRAMDTGSNSLWWKWTAPADGRVRVDCTGSAPNTEVAAYTGDSLAHLNLITLTTNYADFVVAAGTEYHLVLDGDAAQTGNYILAMSFLGLDGRAPLRLETPGLTSDGVSLRVSGIPGLRFLMQVSIDLVNWSDLAAGAVATNGAVVQDANPAQFQKRFYRLTLAP